MIEGSDWYTKVYEVQIDSRPPVVKRTLEDACILAVGVHPKLRVHIEEIEVFEDDLGEQPTLQIDLGF